MNKTIGTIALFSPSLLLFLDQGQNQHDSLLHEGNDGQAGQDSNLRENISDNKTMPFNLTALE